jgi:hypothetical protein
MTLKGDILCANVIECTESCLVLIEIKCGTKGQWQSTWQAFHPRTSRVLRLYETTERMAWSSDLRIESDIRQRLNVWLGIVVSTRAGFLAGSAMV